MTREKSKKTAWQKAVEAIDEKGALLVFPLQNRAQPESLWSVLHPRSKMRWEWDENGDDRVGRLWRLREELSRSREVVYVKWFQGRATFFSRKVFVLLLAYFESSQKNLALRWEAQQILEVLEMDSPLSTKQIKEAAELQGKSFESLYNKAMKELWNPLLVVGFGEIEDSSFPSLAVGAAKTLFEELWQESLKVSSEQAESMLEDFFGSKNLFWKFAQKVRRQSTGGH